MVLVSNQYMIKLKSNKGSHQNIKMQRRKEDIWPYSLLVGWTIWNSEIRSLKSPRSPPNVLLSHILLCPQNVVTTPSRDPSRDPWPQSLWYLVVFHFPQLVRCTITKSGSPTHCVVFTRGAGNLSNNHQAGPRNIANFALWSNAIQGKSFVWEIEFKNWLQDSL